MANKKALNKYPKEYRTLFMEGSLKQIFIQHETPEQAASTRNDLYTFRQVVYDNTPSNEDFIKFVNVRLVVSGSTLIVEPIRSLPNE